MTENKGESSNIPPQYRRFEDRPPERVKRDRATEHIHRAKAAEDLLRIVDAGSPMVEELITKADAHTQAAHIIQRGLPRIIRKPRAKR